VPCVSLSLTRPLGAPPPLATPRPSSDSIGTYTHRFVKYSSWRADCSVPHQPSATRFHRRIAGLSYAQQALNCLVVCVPLRQEMREVRKAEKAAYAFERRERAARVGPPQPGAAPVVQGSHVLSAGNAEV
jgi:hypothetical protein